VIARRRPALPVRWIAHSGLAAGEPGGAPTASTLAAAVRIHVDWIELDVRATRDGHLVLRHDRRLPSGMRVEDVSRAELAEQGCDMLSLDEAVDVVAGRVTILLDIKGRAVAPALARWLARRRDPGAFAVSAEVLDDLLVLRRRVRRVARWRSLPGQPSWASPWPRTLVGLVCHRRDPRGLVPLAAGVVSAARVPGCRRHELLHTLAVVWRRDMPRHLPRLCREADAAGVVVAHRAITPELCDAARRLRLPVAAWTVNRVDAARQVLRCGAGIIVSDRVVPLRLGLAGFGD
jgi:glycerophosphoryl diester phosphodiesterase